MSEAITAVYEISAEDPAGRAAQVAVEQSHELPTELAPGNAIRDSLARVRSVLQRPGRPALVTVYYPADLAGVELGQLLVLLLGNVSLQDDVRLVDVALPARLAAALPGPGPALPCGAIVRTERDATRPRRAPGSLSALCRITLSECMTAGKCFLYSSVYQGNRETDDTVTRIVPRG